MTENPVIEALVGRLPKPGTSWSEKEREVWLEAMRRALAVLYKEPRQRGPRRPRLAAE
jgi:hypothetical protein